ncbi:MAG TPA: aminotransferase class IV, partial [Candidatus Limnocylindria bacterium]|nr:aminotransferase class IV [Candidatus Limnocylindria bacterium]
MIVFLNGQFVPEADAKVSVFDRSFLYGDGLFESVRVYAGQAFRWPQHLERLHAGAKFLGIRIPFTDAELTTAATELVARNGLPESNLRLVLSRGVGPRGYSPKGADSPTLVMTLHPAPVVSPEQPMRWELITSSFRIPAGDRLATFKTA